jgi:hypothetical protein
MHNIGYLSFGYNIFKGDPLNSKLDPGFMKMKIFEFKYE